MSNPRHRSSPAEEEVVEKGDIYFFYRPRVETDDAEGLGDVQQFFMVLKPEGGPFRLTVLGRKRLPDVAGHERIWGFVDMVARSFSEIEDALEGRRYRTRTRGVRDSPPARPAGEGAYALAELGRSLHLTYALELPERLGPAQRALNIERQGAFVLSIKNPQKPAPRGVGLREEDEARYPRPLQREFGGRRFALWDPRLLDYRGAEFILIGARTDPERAYGLDIDAGREPAPRAELVRRLKRGWPAEPMIKGQWR